MKVPYSMNLREDNYFKYEEYVGIENNYLILLVRNFCAYLQLPERAYQNS